MPFPNTDPVNLEELEGLIYSPPSMMLNTFAFDVPWNNMKWLCIELNVSLLLSF
jgi:hypothetical protein